MFPNENGDWGGRKEHRFYSETEVTTGATTTNLITAAMSLKVLDMDSTEETAP